MRPTALLPAVLVAALIALQPGASAAQGGQCSLDGLSLGAGQQHVFYSARSVPLGSECAALAQPRSCGADGLSGNASYRYHDCIELEEFMGVNTNRKPGELDPALLARTGTTWIRSNVEVLTYKDQHDGKVQNQAKLERWDFADWDTYTAAADTGERRAILNLMWDFEARGSHPPLPGSQEEKDLFAYLDLQILDKLAPHVDILTTGNEPFVNTLEEDWHPQEAYGGIPIVVFYQRLTEHVDAYLVDRGLRDQISLYMGAFTRLHTEKMQRQPAVLALLDFAETAPYVDGVDMHTHVVNVNQIGKALAFAREHTSKPIVVTEFTFVWRMKQAIEEGDRLGSHFAKRWGRDANETIHDYMSCEVFALAKGCRRNAGVSKAEWDDFFATRDWYIDHFILQAYDLFRQYGVRGATFGLVQGTPTRQQLQPNRPPWYMGFLFAAAAVPPGADGQPQPNYQYLDDFLTIQQQRAARIRH